MLTWLNKLFPFMLFCGDDDSSSDNEAKYEAAVAPAREQQQIMLDLFKTAYQPYVQDIAGLWSTYGKPTQEAQYSAYSQTLPKLLADVDQPMTLPDSVWQGVWQKAREKTAGEYDTITRKTSQRLASTGGLEQGPGNQLMQQIDFSKAKSIESQAIDQAIAEWNEKKQAKQQAYTNLFTALNYNPQNYSSTLGGLGNYQTSVIPPYTEQEEQGNWLTGATGGWGTASDLMFASSPEQAAQIAMMSAMMFSDIDLKKNIQKIGQLKNGLGIYKWEWKEFAKKIVGCAPTIGVIAQEVMKIIPKAVLRGKHGYLMVDYSLI